MIIFSHVTCQALQFRFVLANVLIYSTISAILSISKYLLPVLFFPNIIIYYVGTLQRFIWPRNRLQKAWHDPFTAPIQTKDFSFIIRLPETPTAGADLAAATLKNF